MGSDDHFDDTSRLLEYGFSAFGPSDIVRAAAVEEGGGGTAPIDMPQWLAVRLAATPPLDVGRWALTPVGTTPGSRMLDAELRKLVPAFLDGSG